MTKVENESLCIQGGFLEKISSPLLNRVKGEGGMDLEAARMTKGALAKTVQAPKGSLSSKTLPTRSTIRKLFLVQVLVDKGLFQGEPV